MSTYEIWLDDPDGLRLGLADLAGSLESVRVANEVGGFSVTLPGDYDTNRIRVDGMVEIWRAPVGGKMALVNVGIIRNIRYSDNSDGKETITISGPNYIDYLHRRIIAYAAGETQSEKTDYADDMIKEIVDENLGDDATDTDRDYSSLISIAVARSEAPEITKGFAWKNMLEVLQEICDASAELNQDLYFDLVPYLEDPNTLRFTLETFTNQIGIDRTADSGNPVYFGKMWGNLGDPVLEYDYNDEVNYVYAGGQGVEDTRELVEVSDSRRIGMSKWNRREGFADARNDDETSGVTAAGYAALNEGRPRLRFSGKLLDTTQYRYGIDWNFGDKVTAEYRGIEFDGMINAVKITVNESGDETIDASIDFLETYADGD